jgi:energy-coupling factor transporter ATP-binding protein EcfA2
MLAIGRALMSRPRLLLLDEPSMGLGAAHGAQDLRDHRRHRSSDGVTILLVEQNANLALDRLSQRAYVMESGSDDTLSGREPANSLRNPKVRARSLSGRIERRIERHPLVKYGIQPLVDLQCCVNVTSTSARTYPLAFNISIYLYS